MVNVSARSGRRRSMLLSVGTASLDDVGVAFLTAELGQPHMCCLLSELVFGPEYSGSAKLSRVARQLSTVNGESIDISKWRLLASGSSLSFRDILMTI